MTFTKTNFTGYSIHIRGIGTQAISVTTDPAVAVALTTSRSFAIISSNRNSTTSVRPKCCAARKARFMAATRRQVWSISSSAKPTDQFEAMASGDIGNYHNRRFEGMINLPIVDDRLDLRIAGEWTKRQGYSFNRTYRSAYRRPRSVVGPCLRWLEAVCESANQARLGAFLGRRRPYAHSKQLCKTAPIPATTWSGGWNRNSGGYLGLDAHFLSQGCLPTLALFAGCV